MKKLALLLIFLGLCLNANAQTSNTPKTFNYAGTAGTTNSQQTVAFQPKLFCVSNDGTTNNLYINFSGTATGGSSDFVVYPGKEYCFTLAKPGSSNGNGGSGMPNGWSLIGFITTASTTAYHINGEWD